MSYKNANFLPAYIFDQKVDAENYLGVASNIEQFLRENASCGGGGFSFYLDQTQFFSNPLGLNLEVEKYTPIQILDFMAENGLKVTALFPFSLSGLNAVYNLALPSKKIGYLSWARLLSWCELDSQFSAFNQIIQRELLPLLPWFFCERAFVVFEPGDMLADDYSKILGGLGSSVPSQETLAKVLGRIKKFDLNERSTLAAYYLISELKEYEATFLDFMPASFLEQYAILKIKDEQDFKAKNIVENWWKSLPANHCLVYEGISLANAMEYELLEILLDDYFNAF